MGVNGHPAHVETLDARVFRLPGAHSLENPAQQVQLGQVGEEQHIEQAVSKRGRGADLVVGSDIGHVGDQHDVAQITYFLLVIQEETDLGRRGSGERSKEFTDLRKIAVLDIVN